MRLFGFDITRPSQSKDVVPVYGRYGGSGGWYPVINEPFAGAWQRNMEIKRCDITAFHPVFACITLIASDIKKLRVKTIKESADGVWLEIKSSPKTAVLSAPNQYQNSKQFWESWILSKLLRGNTYVLKSRDARGVVNQLYVLDPCRVQVLVSDNKREVFYEVSGDNLSTASTETITIPASEIMHDRMNTFFHPLCGLSPLYAAHYAAEQGMAIQGNSSSFFQNRSIPGGILTAPGAIADATAERLKTEWNQRYTGANSGNTAVLGDGLKFEAMAVTAEDSQLIEQLKATAEAVCEAFHVPPWKIGLAPNPSPANPQAANVEYYSQCLQAYIEDAEECLDRGLELTPNIGVEFDTEGLLRMDTLTQMTVLEKGVHSGLFAPNEGRAKLGYAPAKGGNSPMVQQQMFSLEALAERDAAKPFAKPAAPAPAVPADAPPTGDNAPDDNGGDSGDSAKQIAEILFSKARQYARSIA